MIIIDKINYVKDDLSLEIYMQSSIIIKIWADPDSFNYLNVFREALISAIANRCIMIDIPGELNVNILGAMR